MCPHVHLIKVVNIEQGGKDSTTYECQVCHQLFTISTYGIDIVTTFGRPKEPTKP